MLDHQGATLYHLLQLGCASYITPHPLIQRVKETQTEEVRNGGAKVPQVMFYLSLQLWPLQCEILMQPKMPLV